MGEFNCNTITKTNVFSGCIFVTQNYFCFYANRQDPVIVAIPWKQVLSIQKGVTVKTQSDNITKVMVADDVSADALQLFTPDNAVHQFNGFVELYKVWNLLNYLWKTHAVIDQYNIHLDLK